MFDLYTPDRPATYLAGQDCRHASGFGATNTGADRCNDMHPEEPQAIADAAAVAVLVRRVRRTIGDYLPHLSRRDLTWIVEEALIGIAAELHVHGAVELPRVGQLTRTVSARCHMASLGVLPDIRLLALTARDLARSDEAAA